MITIEKALTQTKELLVDKLASALTRKFETTLHWFPIAQHISYRIAVLVWWCFIGSAPAYLCELCIQTGSLSVLLHNSVIDQ